MKKITIIIIAISLSFGASGVAQVSRSQAQYDADVKSLNDTAKRNQIQRNWDNNLKTHDTSDHRQKWNSFYDYYEQTAKYIFEGIEITKGIPFRDVNANNATHISRKIIVTKIYKNSDGKLKLGTVQLIDDTTPIWLNDDGSTMIVPIDDWHHPITNGVYFCNDYYKPSPYKITTDNEPIALAQIYGENKEVYYKRKNITPIQDTLLQKKSPNENEIKQSPKLQNVIEDTTGNGQRYKEHLDNYQSYMNKLQIKLLPKSHGEKALESISFSIGFATQTTSGPNHYLEFDVLANCSSDTTFFDNCLLRISYDTNSFGSNIVANNNVTITKGSNYNSVTYFDPNTNDIDWTPYMMDVPFGTDFSQTTLYRTNINTSLEQLLHFKMLIRTCNTNPQVAFADIDSTYFFSFFALNPSDSITNTLPYDTSYYSGSITQTLCAPFIGYFTPTAIPGAHYPLDSINEALVDITGINFGSVKGTVWVPNADTGGLGGPIIPLNNNDIIYWSDNLIRIIMPSIVDSFPASATDSFWTYPCPGSGIFQIATSNGIASSYAPIYFPYAIKNIINNAPYSKARLDLANVNTNGGYVFMLDTSIISFNASNPILIPLIQKAIKEVACKTGATITMGGPISDNGFNPDAICTIFFMNAPSDTGVLADTRTSLPVFFCESPSFTEKYFIQKAMKIGILRDPSLFSLPYWQFDTIQADLSTGRIGFYQALMHELLHAVGEKHVDQQELMYWKTPSGFIAGPLRDSISSNDGDGGGDIVYKSSFIDTITAVCGPYTNLIVYHDCVNGGNSFGIPNINPNVLNMKMYPNPLNDNLLNIQYTLKQDSRVTFKVLDITGREVYSMNENLNAGEHTDQLNLDNLAIGVYLIKIIIGDTQDTQKLVKIR